MPISLRESITTQCRLPRNEDLLKGRAELLAQDDRILIEAVLLQGQSAEVIARMMRTTGRSIRFKVHRLTRRLSSRRFLDAARALPYLLPDDARIARLYFCQGLSQRGACKVLNLTPHQLRRKLDLISGQITTLRRQRHAAGWRGLQQDDDQGQLAEE